MGKKSRWGKKADDGDGSEDKNTANADGGLHLLNAGDPASGTNLAQDHIAVGVFGRAGKKQSEFDRAAGTTVGPTSDQLAKFLQLVSANDPHCFCLHEGACFGQDRSFFDGILQEFDFRPSWSEVTGARLRRDVLDMGDPANADLWRNAPTYRRLVQLMIRKFEIGDPVRSVINFYRDGTNKVGWHRDYYSGGINFTVGVSLGATRNLEFIDDDELKRQREQEDTNRMYGSMFSFPQSNGDIFAFSDFVNSRFRHGVPVSDRPAGPRISVVIWGRRGGPKSEYAPYEGDFHVRFAGSDNEHVVYDKPPSVGVAG